MLLAWLDEKHRINGLVLILKHVSLFKGAQQDRQMLAMFVTLCCEYITKPEQETRGFSACLQSLCTGLDSHCCFQDSVLSVS